MLIDYKTFEPIMQNNIEKSKQNSVVTRVQ